MEEVAVFGGERGGEPGMYRISSATLEGESLRIRFSDGKEGRVPCARVAPRRGSPDWGRMAVRLKGAHVAVPVAGGDFDEHEIPWDVLRALVDAGFSIEPSEAAFKQR